MDAVAVRGHTGAYTTNLGHFLKECGTYLQQAKSSIVEALVLLGGRCVALFYEIGINRSNYRDFQSSESSSSQRES